LKEPMLWFFIIGVLLFGADSYFSGEPNQVVVDARVRDHLDKLWQTQTGKPATPRELDSLVDNWIKEEIFFREAIQLGLDRDDTIIRRRLVQKLGFLMEEVEEETDEWLGAEKYYYENLQYYSVPVRYSFSQIYFKEEADVQLAKKQISEGAHWRELGEPSMLNENYTAQDRRQIRASFGEQFVSQMPKSAGDAWHGPVQSSFGFHLVKLDRVFKKETTPLAYIEKRVLSDYRQSRKDAAMDGYYQGLLEKYEIVRD